MDEDNSPLLLQTAVIHAQSDERTNDISEKIVSEDEDDKEERDFALEEFYLDE